MSRTVEDVIESFVRKYGEDMRKAITEIAYDAADKARKRGDDLAEWAEIELLDRL